MWIRHLEECPVIQAGDGTALREVLHPARPETKGIPLRFSLAHARLAAGGCSRPHRLLQSSEVYYILEGQGIVSVGDQKRPVKSGHIVYIPPGSIQWIENTGSGPLVFLAIVDPPWRPEDERVLEPEEMRQSSPAAD